MGASIAFHLAEAGVARRPPARARRSSASGSTVEGGRRRARPVLRPGQHRPRRCAASTRSRTSRTDPARRSTCTSPATSSCSTDPEQVRVYERVGGAAELDGRAQPHADRRGGGRALPGASTPPASWPRPSTPATATAARSRSSSATPPARAGTAPPSSRASRSPASRVDGRTASRPSAPTAATCAPTRSSAPPARGRRRSARWPASICRSSRCVARSSSPSRCPDAQAALLPADMPMTIDAATTFYLHREGPGDPARHVLPARGAGLPRRLQRGVAAGSDDRHRAALPRPARRGHRAPMGGLVRGDAGPQRPGRRGRRRVPVPLRGRLLRTRLPAGTGGRRGHPRPVPAAASRSSTSRRFSAERFARGTMRGEVNIV